MANPHLAWVLLLATACATSGGMSLADPSSANPSSPHPVGEPVYVNAGGGVEAAVAMTAIAGAGAVIQHAAGGCYANCPPGTSCNAKTGFCEELPCRGLCTGGAYCDTSGPFAHCVRSPMVDLKIDKGSRAP